MPDVNRTRSVKPLPQIWRELGIPDDYAAIRGLALQPECKEAELLTIGTNPGGRLVRLTRQAAAAWTSLQAAAATDGIVLLPLSGFRSIARQEEIIREKLFVGRPLADILRLIAAPGCSEHHTGRALDLGTPDEPPLEEDFAETAAFGWLMRRAGDFGFQLTYPRDNPHGIVYEPWHWCWQA
ncbi:MAG: D-alanyl-D-alanine carboxypeptidase family protein [Opitutaceae bacterium]|nr:D-alanyl-D-alanine carboxypeptidase family protein [Opitutaceae bacterium]